MDQFGKYLDKTYHFLSFRPRSEKEVRDNLAKKKAPQEIIDRVLTQLKDHKFVNDEEFARWFIEQRLRFRPKSLNLIKLELKQKGISKDVIDELAIRNNEFGAETDIESAKKLVEKKIDKYRDLDKQEIYHKLGAYLARRGFNWDTIKKSIDEFLAKGV
jgi:regulatory protein